MSEKRTYTDLSSMNKNDKRTHRREQLRLAAQRKRDRERDTGSVEMRIKLTAAEAEEFQRLLECFRGSRDTFPSTALMLGAKFAANIGQGTKKPAKSGPGNQGIL